VNGRVIVAVVGLACAAVGVWWALGEGEGDSGVAAVATVATVEARPREDKGTDAGDRFKQVAPVGGGGRLQNGAGTAIPDDFPLSAPGSWRATSALESATAAFVVFEAASAGEAEARAALAATGCPVTEVMQGEARVLACGPEPRWQGVVVSVVPGTSSRISVAWRR
jgi:hypothetical protein